MAEEAGGCLKPASRQVQCDTGLVVLHWQAVSTKLAVMRLHQLARQLCHHCLDCLSQQSSPGHPLGILSQNKWSLRQSRQRNGASQPWASKGFVGDYVWLAGARGVRILTLNAVTVHLHRVAWGPMLWYLPCMVLEYPILSMIKGHLLKASISLA